MGKVIVRVILCLLCMLGASYYAHAQVSEGQMARPYGLQEKYIHSFRHSLGFIRSTENDSIALYGDSLVSVLDAAREYDKYFELERIVIRAHILRGESRIAIARSDLMYSKAQAMGDSYGLALSMNAIGEVYTYISRLEDARFSFKEALSYLKDPSENKALTKLLLLELINNSLHLDDIGAAREYLEQLNKYNQQDLSPLEQGIFHNYNAFYCIRSGEMAKAYQYLEAAWKLLPELPLGIVQHLLVTESSYYDVKGEYDKALDACNRFFEVEKPERDRWLYIDVMRNKADLLVKMDNKEEAFKQYANIYSYVNAIFKETYPKEIDQLCTRFQADQLKYQNERSRALSIRFFVAGIVICTLVFIFFISQGWQKIFRLRESKKKQEEMKRKAENAIRKKNLFLSNMSHEVRTPLNAIVGFSTLLAAEEDMGLDVDSRKEACEIIRVNSQQLLKLINDILDLSDFEEENIHFHIKEYDAVKVCNEVIETIKASYKLNLELRFETEYSSLMLDTDDSRLRQVLINLLVNAVKFTKQGSIVLKLERGDADTALFSVTDTGCGIPIEKQKLIFERFEKLDEFVHGSGLGLSICQLIVKYVGGKIWIDESYVTGARFCFTHPLKYKSTLF